MSNSDLFPYVLSSMPWLGSISLTQEKMNSFIDIFLPFSPNKNHLTTLWSCEKNCRKSKQLIQWLDWLSSLVSILLPFKNNVSPAGREDSVPLCGSPGSHLSFWSGASLPHPPEAAFPISEVACLSQDDFFAAVDENCRFTTCVHLDHFSFLSRLFQRIYLEKTNT